MMRSRAVAAEGDVVTMPATIDALWTQPARTVATMLARREIAPIEAVDAAIARIEAVDGVVNAVVQRRFDRARAEARKPQAAPLHGLPVLIKDMTDVAGLASSWGDPEAAQPRPASDILVRTLEARGGIVLGKTNVPLLGLGNDTVNPLYGTTRNPWRLTHSTAGSSGGAAAALAAGMAWLAHGSDLGGSIRGPSSMCGTTGLRPSPGRIAQGGIGTARPGHELLSQNGPMARDVRDCALFMEAMAAGAHAEDPLSSDLPPGGFGAPPRLPRRVAFAPDLGGHAPVERDVLDVLHAVARQLEAAGVEVVPACFDCAGVADACYDIRLGSTRASYDAARHARLRAHLPPILDTMLNDAHALTLDRLLAAQNRHTKLVNDARDFMAGYDLLLCPAAPHAARPLGSAGENEIAGRRLRHWAEGALPAYAITMSLLPALTLPGGFAPDGLPVGVQLVGKPRGEPALFAHGAAIEDFLALAPRIPIEPIGG
jgi:amidase